MILLLSFFHNPVMTTGFRETPPLSPLALKGPFLLHEALLPTALLVIALCIPRQSWVVTSIFLPAILAAHYRLLYTTSPNPSFGYAIGTYAAMHAYISFNLLIFSNPRRDFLRLRSFSRPGVTNGIANASKEGVSNKPQEGDGYPEDSLLRRLGWVIELTESLRGVGWNWQIRSIRPLDKRELTSVRTFFRRRAVRLIMIWLWLDFLCWLMKDIDGAYFVPEGNAHNNPETFIPLYSSLFAKPNRDQEFPPPKGFPPIPQGDKVWFIRGVYKLALRSARVSFAATAMYNTINASFTLLSVIAALMGCIFGLGLEGGWRRRWLDWRVWPDVFGGWKQGDWGHGLSGWWGMAWHGLFKNSFIAPGRFIISKLGLRKDGPATKTINLILPFVFSSILHFAGCFTQSGGGWGTMRFFLVQPFGIAAENIILYFYHRFVTPSMRSSFLERYVPYLWVLIWFTAVSPSFFDEYRYGGVWCVDPIPVSVYMGVCGRGWWHWGQSADGRVWWNWHESLGGWGIQL